MYLILYEENHSFHRQTRSIKVFLSPVLEVGCNFTKVKVLKCFAWSVHLNTATALVVSSGMWSCRWPSEGRAKKSRQTNVYIKIYSVFRNGTSPLPRGGRGYVTNGRVPLTWRPVSRPSHHITSRPDIEFLTKLYVAILLCLHSGTENRGKRV
jgi:hypothetical protein